VNAQAFFSRAQLDVKRYVGRYTPIAVPAPGTGPTFAIALGGKPKAR
jgi:hypothetical protein